MTPDAVLSVDVLNHNCQSRVMLERITGKMDFGARLLVLGADHRRCSAYEHDIRAILSWNAG